MTCSAAGTTRNGQETIPDAAKATANTAEMSRNTEPTIRNTAEITRCVDEGDP